MRNKRFEPGPEGGPEFALTLLKEQKVQSLTNISISHSPWGAGSGANGIASDPEATIDGMALNCRG